MVERGQRKMHSRESLRISQQPVPGPWGPLFPIPASSQDIGVRSSLSPATLGASLTWDDCSEEVWLLYHSKTGGSCCGLICVDTCYL